MLETLRTTRAVLRSLRLYYGDRQRRDAMAALYARFVRPGDLVFDIGAHVGDRIAAFRSLGARVVAVEPQPALVRVLRFLYGRDRDVTVVRAAVGATAGEADILLNIDNPTVSTLSPDFVRAADGSAGWEGQHWTGRGRVPVTTLDALIVAHGLPAFIKIDVEGYEAEALAGLSCRVPALSFEFTTIQRDVAMACLTRCAALGMTGFDAALGESQTMVHGVWRDEATTENWIASLPHATNSGDIYAVAPAVPRDGIGMAGAQNSRLP
jgi:FkbM family methyltransferase